MKRQDGGVCLLKLEKRRIRGDDRSKKQFIFIEFKIIECIIDETQNIGSPEAAWPVSGERKKGFYSGEIIMRVLGFILAAALAMAMLVNDAVADGRYGKQKVVYHINHLGGDGGKAYSAAMTNIQNHIDAVGKDNIDVKVVLHGNGLGLLAAAKDIDKLKVAVARLKSQNVGFNVCDNTLKGRKINYEKDLFDVYKEDIVPSGVAEISRLQQMGYTYIKP